MKYYILLLFVFLLGGSLVAQNNQDEVIFKAMQDEMDRNKNELVLEGQGRPFYLSYAVGMSEQFEIVGVLGSITNKIQLPFRSVATVQTLLGDYNATSDSRYIGQGPRVSMPVEADYDLIRRNFWLATDAMYKNALREKASKEAYLKANPLTEEEARLADLTPAEPIDKVVEGKDFTCDMDALQEQIRELSAIFKEYKDIFNSRVVISGFNMDVYKKTTEGVTIKVPMQMVNLFAQGTVRTPEGVSISDAYQILVPRPQDLPAMEELKKSVRQFAEGLVGLKNAPQLNEFYSGPVMFEGGAAANIFSSTLLNQSGLFAYRKPAAQAQMPQAVKTLENRMDRKIIDNRISVKNYSKLDKYNGTPLIGAYEVDAEGVIPADEQLLIEKGILKSFLNGRVPALKAEQSTGSSRFIMTNTDLAYATAPGTIHVEVEKGVKPDKMKKALIKAAKEEGVDYAYIVRKVAGPASLIYQVNLKDGSETQVRFGDLSHINLAKVKRMLEISSKENVSNYILNRQVVSSLIYPSAIIIEDVEISQSVLKPEKEPTLVFPLLRD